MNINFGYVLRSAIYFYKHLANYSLDSRGLQWGRNITRLVTSVICKSRDSKNLISRKGVSQQKGQPGWQRNRLMHVILVETLYVFRSAQSGTIEARAKNIMIIDITCSAAEIIVLSYTETFTALKGNGKLKVLDFTRDISCLWPIINLQSYEKYTLAFRHTHFCRHDICGFT